MAIFGLAIGVVIMIVQRIVSPEPFFSWKTEVADPAVLDGPKRRLRMARTIVVGYDGSDGAGVALEKAIELAKLEAARIVVVFAYEIPAAYGGETGDYRRVVRERAEEATAKAVPRLEEAGVEFTIALVPERPTDGLVMAPKEHDASMIVVGTNGEHPIKGVVLGSVAHKLLHVSDVPVLVVPTTK